MRAQGKSRTLVTRSTPSLGHSATPIEIVTAKLPLSEDDHVTRVGLLQALADLDSRGLAGAVGTEETEAFARLDLEVEAVDRDNRAERLPESVYFERECHRSR